MVNLNQAINFVNTNGNEIEKARMKSLLLGTQPDQNIIQELTKYQNEDGGFSYFTKDISTVFDTIYILTWLDDLQLRDGELVNSAFEFLIKNQQDDTGWDEVSEVANLDASDALPPGEIDTRVFLTAFCAHWLVRFDRTKEMDNKGEPLEFITNHRNPDGLILDDQQTTWDSLVLFSRSPGKESELFAETIEIIEKKFSPDELMGGNLAYLLCCLRDAGLDAYHPIVNLSTDELIQKQREDGSWESEYGDEYATAATIEALRVLKHYNVV
jgi:hypothetical protein